MQERRLAAIMFTDIVGYTDMMSRDESQTLRIIEKNRQIHLDCFQKYSGTLIKQIGDGILSSFNSSLKAVKCAIEIQGHVTRDDSFTLRIGIHQGDILFTDNDIFGDGVNIASRIESLAAPGGICITGEIAASIRSSGIKVKYLGLKELKNAGQRKIWAIAENGIPIPDGFPEEKIYHIPNNLPQATTSFIGRKKELSKVKELINEHRLVTLTGAGGSGKTRLALKVGISLMNEFEDGVWLVELADVLNPRMVLQEVSQVLGIKELYGRDQAEFIAERITNKNILLILDNCEHLIDACANMLDYLLAHSIKPKFLTTSREVLNIGGEESWSVPVLQYPEESEPEYQRIATYESVQLFCERASISGKKLAITPQNADIIGNICRQLDGIPLALELAASRIRVMQPELILSRLGDKFRFLKSNPRSHQVRHQTLKATLDWSFDLLPEDEKILFRRLSVFAGDFSLDAVEKICGFGLIRECQVLDLLQQLIDKSMVVVKPNEHGDFRYQLLEIMKQYGKEYLTDTDESQQLKENYFEYFKVIAESSYFNYLRKTTYWIFTIEKDYSNIQAALEYMEDEPSHQLQLAGYLAWYWFIQSRFIAGISYLEKPLNNYRQRDIIKGRALNGLGILMVFVNPKSLELLNEANDILINLKAPYDQVLNFSWHGFALCIYQYDLEEGTKKIEHGIQIATAIDNPWLISQCKTKSIFPRIGPQFAEDNKELAISLEPVIRKNLDEATRLNIPEDIGWNLIFYGDCAFLKRDGKAVEQRYGEALKFNHQIKNKQMSCIAMIYIAYGLAMQNRYPKAQRLIEAALIGYESVGTTREMIQTKAIQIIKVRQHVWHPKAAGVSDDLLSQYVQEGAAFTWDEAVAYALDVSKD